jgi:hypothetical protein
MLKLLLLLAAAGAAQGDEVEPAARRSLIVGGTVVPAANNRFSALASFRYIKNGVESVGCAGVLVAPNLVATSASCIFVSEKQTRLPDRIVFNDRLMSTTETTEVERAAVEGTMHENYDVVTFQANIAVVRLDQPVTTIRPVQLSATIPPPGTTLTTAGFGRTTRGFFPIGMARPTERSNQLVQINVQVGASDLECQRDTARGQIFDPKSMFCVKASLNQGVCGGDEGGPLIAQDGTLVGVLSNNLNCAVPDESIVFARLGGQSGLRPFIFEQIAAAAGAKPASLPTRAAKPAVTRPPTRPPQVVLPAKGNGNGPFATPGGGAASGKDYIDVLMINNDIDKDAATKARMGNDLIKDIAFAVNRWNAIITSSLPPFTTAQAVDLSAANMCGVAKAVIPAGTVIQNMLLMINVAPMDGLGKREARAKQCAFSSDAAGRRMPRVGIITLDIADVVANRLSGNTASTVMHQIGHLLGIGGAAWKQRVTEAGYGGVNGINALRGFQAIGGKGVRIPVQPVNPALEPGLVEAGVQDAHWSRAAVGSELMGAKLNQAVGQTVSLLTLGSLMDLGYSVDLNEADRFEIVAQASVTAKPTTTAKPTVKVTAKPTVKVTAKPTVKVTAKPTAAAAVTAKPTAAAAVTAKPTVKVTAKPTPGAPLLGRRLQERLGAAHAHAHAHDHGHGHARTLQDTVPPQDNNTDTVPPQDDAYAVPEDDSGATFVADDWVDWSEGIEWPDLSQRALFIGEKGTWWEATPRTSLESQIAEESETGSRNGSSGLDSSIGTIGAGLGGAFAMLALVAVVSMMRKKNSDAFATSNSVVAVDNRMYRKQHSYV